MPIPIRTRPLGTSGLQLTTIGFGTFALGGGDWKFGWGAQDDAESIRAIGAGLDAGINWIDTAPIYGHGRAEEVVGRAIAGHRHEVVVATKCGRVWEGESRDIFKSLRRESVLAECDASLRRLKIDAIDLYQLHWPEPDEQVEEGWAAIGELIQAGKVLRAGVCNFSVSQLQRAQAIRPIASLQPPYSLLKRDIEAEILPWCEANGIGIVAYSPMQAGLLTGTFTRERAAALAPDDWRSRHPFFQEPQLSRHLAIADGLRPLAARLGITVAQLALAWTLRDATVTSAIAGARSAKQIEETVQAGNVDVPPDVIDAIEQLLRA